MMSATIKVIIALGPATLTRTGRDLSVYRAHPPTAVRDLFNERLTERMMSALGYRGLNNEAWVIPIMFGDYFDFRRGSSDAMQSARCHASDTATMLPLAS